MSGGRRGPVEGGSRAALPRAREHPRRPDEQAQERGRQGVAQTRTQAHQNQHCGRGPPARRTQCMARRTRRLPRKDHGQTGSRARQAQAVVDHERCAAPGRPVPMVILRPRQRGTPPSTTNQLEGGTNAVVKRTPTTTESETVLRMDGVYAHPSFVTPTTEIHRKGTGGGRRADARDRDRRATAGRRRRRLRHQKAGAAALAHDKQRT